MYHDSTIPRPSRVCAAWCVLLALSGLGHQAWAVAPTAEEMEAAKQFAAEKLFSADSAKLPFSFTYGGKPSSELLNAWQRQETSETLDQAREVGAVLGRFHRLAALRRPAAASRPVAPSRAARS